MGRIIISQNRDRHASRWKCGGNNHILLYGVTALYFDVQKAALCGGFRLCVHSVHRKRHCLKLGKAMCPYSFPVSKVAHLPPRKKWTILALFFSINFMLCDVLLPKIQPLSKPGNPDSTMTLFWKKLLCFMLGENGRFSTTYCNQNLLKEKHEDTTILHNHTTLW